MELIKWKCGICGFEWFESFQSSKISNNIDHGCPQGCDDAGKVIGMAKTTE